MMSEACESSAGIYRNGLTFLAGGTVVARDSGRSCSPKGFLRNRWLTARDLREHAASFLQPVTFSIHTGSRAG